jgi:hypothetical protein
MSGHWPPEWEDQDEEFPEEADQLNADTEARLSEVTAYLASLSAPVLPANVEARISAALAVEAATRAGAAAADDDVASQPEDPPAARSRYGSTTGTPAASRTLGGTPARARAERHRGRPRLSRPLVAVGSLVVCLLLVGLGFRLSRSASGPTFSSAASGASNASAAAPAAAPSAASGFAGTASSFVVTESGTRYRSATLAAQVQARLTANNGTPVEVPGPRPASPRNAASSSAASGPADVPTSVLSGCVLHLTGGQTPRLVDRATYQGEPAYIIATSSRVWVTGLGCTAAKPEVIVSVPLAR